MIDRLRALPTPLYFLFAGTTVTRLGAFVFPYLTIYLSAARGFATSEVGLVLSVGSLGLLLGNLVGGWLTDCWSRVGTLVVALLVNAVGFAFLAAPWQELWPYALFLFVGYLGSGMYPPAAQTLIADLTDEAIRPFAYTVNYVCINLGMGVGPLLGGVLAASSYAWLFIGDVATSLCCALLIAVGVRGLASRRRVAGTAPALRIGYVGVWRRHPRVFLFGLANFFLIAPLMGLEYAVPLLVKTEFAAPLHYVGVVYTINAACILGLSFLVERWLRGRTELPWMAVAGVLWTAGLAMLHVGFSVPALLLCTVVWTCGEIVASILVPTFIARHTDPAVKGRFMALGDLVRSAAAVASPLGLGLVWEHHGASTVTAILLGLPVCGVLCYAGLALAARRGSGHLVAARVSGR
ncbi:MAG: MFS transporter [Planctomycetota bacterium]